MSKFNLDLSKFRKIKSDEKSSVLKHSDGHELKIAHSKLSPAMRKQLEKIPMPQKLADGGDVLAMNEPVPQPNSSEMPSNDPLADAESPAVSPSIPSAQPAAAPVSQPMIPAKAEMGASGDGLAQADTASDPYGSLDAIKGQLQGIGEQKLGQQMSAQAQGNLGTAQAKVEQGYQNESNKIYSDYEQNLKPVMAERAALQKEISDFKIDPKHYINSMSTGKEVMTAIGLILGGFGGGSNLAVDYLQKQIDRDIEGQKSELGKKENLLSHNYQATQDLRSAMDLSRIHSNDILSSQLKMEAAKAQNPIAQGNLLDIAGKFDQQSAQIQHNYALQKAMLGGLGQQGGDDENKFKMQTQYLRMNGQEKMAEDMEKKHVPGIGQASKEVPNDVMNQMIMRKDLQDKIEDLQAFAKKNSGSLSPATVAEGSAKAKLLQDAYRRANAQGVFKESEKNFVEGIASSNPTQFFEKYRAGKGYQEMARDNMSTLNNIKKGYGLPASEAKQESEVKTMNGVPYVKVPGGWKRAT